jgi:Tat protein translocase TatB subunit
MFGIGMSELMVIMVIALIVIGPKNLPEIAKTLGKGYLQFQRAFREVKGSIEEEIDEIKKETDVSLNLDLEKEDKKKEKKEET